MSALRQEMADEGRQHHSKIEKMASEIEKISIENTHLGQLLDEKDAQLEDLTQLKDQLGHNANYKKQYEDLKRRLQDDTATGEKIVNL